MSHACFSCRKWDLETKRPLDGYVRATTQRIHPIGVNGRPVQVVHALCALCSLLWDMDVQFEADGRFRDASAMYAAAMASNFQKGTWTSNCTNPKWGGWV